MIARNIFLLSDSSGNLLEHFTAAVMTQFPEHAFHVKTVPFLNSEEKISALIGSLSAGIVLHAFVSKSLKRAAAESAAKRHIPCWDVTGPTAEFIQNTTGVRSFARPHSLHPWNARYHERIEALEYTMQHDDSLQMETVSQAEIILVGVSRVSKSPTALFLAYRGYKVANVSIVPSLGIPECLKTFRKKKVIAITSTPARLTEIRQSRLAKWNAPLEPYGRLSHVAEELRDAEILYAQMGWPVVNAADLSVEETSALILSTLNLRPKIFN